MALPWTECSRSDSHSLHPFATGSLHLTQHGALETRPGCCVPITHPSHSPAGRSETWTHHSLLTIARSSLEEPQLGTGPGLGGQESDLSSSLIFPDIPDIGDENDHDNISNVSSSYAAALPDSQTPQSLWPSARLAHSTCSLARSVPVQSSLTSACRPPSPCCWDHLLLPTTESCAHPGVRGACS